MDLEKEGGQEGDTAVVAGTGRRSARRPRDADGAASEMELAATASGDASNSASAALLSEARVRRARTGLETPYGDGDGVAAQDPASVAAVASSTHRSVSAPAALVSTTALSEAPRTAAPAGAPQDDDGGGGAALAAGAGADAGAGTDVDTTMVGVLIACCLCETRTALKSTRPMTTDRWQAATSTEFAEWSARQGRPLAPFTGSTATAAAAGDEQERVCLPCLNQLKKISARITCSGCGDVMDGGRYTGAALRKIGWYTAAQETVDLVRDMICSGDNTARPAPMHVGDGDRTTPAAPVELWLCSLCRRVAPARPAAGEQRPGLAPNGPVDVPATEATAAPVTVEDLQGIVNRLHAVVFKQQDTNPLSHPKLPAYLLDATVLRVVLMARAAPMIMSAVFDKVFWPLYVDVWRHSLPAGGHAAPGDNVKTEAQRKYSSSRVLVRIRSLYMAGGAQEPLLVVPVDLGGAAKTFVLTSNVKHLATALVRAQAAARPVGVQQVASTAAAELRAWARRHAVPLAVSAAAGVGPARPQQTAQGEPPAARRPVLMGGQSLRDMLDSASAECPTLSTLLEHLLPETSEDAEDDADADGHPLLSRHHPESEYGARTVPGRVSVPAASVSARANAGQGGTTEKPPLSVPALRRTSLLCMLAYAGSRRVQACGRAAP